MGVVEPNWFDKIFSADLPGWRRASFASKQFLPQRWSFFEEQLGFFNLHVCKYSFNMQ